jgi:hypothetical protein
MFGYGGEPMCQPQHNAQSAKDPKCLARNEESGGRLPLLGDRIGDEPQGRAMVGLGGEEVDFVRRE